MIVAWGSPIAPSCDSTEFGSGVTRVDEDGFPPGTETCVYGREGEETNPSWDAYLLVLFVAACCVLGMAALSARSLREAAILGLSLAAGSFFAVALWWAGVTPIAALLVGLAAGALPLLTLRPQQA